MTSWCYDSMNKKYIVSLQDSEKEMLNELISKRISTSPIVLNAQILLASDVNGLGLTDEEISKRYQRKKTTIQRIREKFVLHGIDMALKGLPRGPQKKRLKIDGEVEAHLVKLACSESPAGYNDWSLRLLADKAVELKYVPSISHESVRQVLKKMKQNHGNTKCG